MERFKDINWRYSYRTRRYYLEFEGAKRLVSKISSIIGRTATRYMIVKLTNYSFEIFEFFLLELDYALTKMKKEYPDYLLEFKIGLIDDLLEFLRTFTWLKDRYNPKPIKFDFKRLEKLMKFKPLKHQLKAYEKYEEIKRLSNLRGFLLDMGVGAGKTFTSLSLGELLGYNYFLIIAPKNTVNRVWEDSINGGLYKKPQPYILLGSRDKKIKRVKFIITHYEYVEKLLKDENKELLKKLRPFLIIDEWHNFNEIKSKRTQALIELVDYVDFKDIALLTGTPLKWDLPELVPMLYVLDKKFPPIADRFIPFYNTVKFTDIDLLKYRFGLYRERIENTSGNLPNLYLKEVRVRLPDSDKYLLETIKREVSEYIQKRVVELEEHYEEYKQEWLKLLDKVIRVVKKDKTLLKKLGLKSVDDLKHIIDEYIKTCYALKEASDRKDRFKILALSPKAKEIEQKYIFKILKDKDLKRFKEIASIIKYPYMKAMGEALGKIVLGRRIECYSRIASKLEYKPLLSVTKKKGIVFSNYIGVCEKAKIKLKKEGYRPISVYGDDTKILSEIVKKFNDPRSPYNPIVTTYKSLSTGVPLTVANSVICIDLPFRNYIFRQAIGRAWRIGNNEDVYIWIVRLDTGDKPNITDRDLFIISFSQKNTEMITDIKENYDLPTPENLTKERNTEETDDEDIIEEEVEEIAEDTLEKLIKNVTRTKNKSIIDYYRLMIKILD